MRILFFFSPCLPFFVVDRQGGRRGKKYLSDVPHSKRSSSMFYKAAPIIITIKTASLAGGYWLPKARRFLALMTWS